MAVSVDGFTIQLDQLLGKGRFSRVYAATSPSGEPKAAKIFRSAWVEDAKEEIENLTHIKTHVECPNLITYDTVLQCERFKSPIVIMPRLGPSVLKLLEWRYDFRDMGHSEETLGLPRWVAAAITRDSLRGLAALHSIGLIHSDIKPENILLAQPLTSAAELAATPDARFVVVDVGSAMRKTEAQGNQHGTSGYRAPELVTHQPVFDEAIDVASLGAIAFEMRTRDALYNLDDDDDDDDDSSSEGSASSRDDSMSDTDTDDSLRDVQEDMLTARLMQELWGRFPQSMVRRSINSAMIFNSRGGILYAPQPSKDSVILDRLIGPEYRMPLEEAQLFADFLHSTCSLSPKKRLAAAVAVEHAWLDAPPFSLPEKTSEV